MTKFIVDREAFPQWHYKNDRTHVSFFARPTFSWLAGKWDAETTYPENGIVLLRKRPACQKTIAS